MEYTQLDDYRLGGGRLTAWTPTPVDFAWRGDERELSFDHEAHLRDSEDGSWIGSIMRVPHPLEAGVLRRALRGWFDRHEVLRATVIGSADGGWTRQVAAAGDIDVLADHGRVVEGDVAHAAIDEILRRVSPRRWPHLTFITLEDSPDSFVLGFGADHSVMDAYSQLLWFGEVVDLYRRAIAGDPDRELARTEAGSHVDFAAFDRRLGLLVGPRDEAITRWERFLGGRGEQARFPSFPDPRLAERDPAIESLEQQSHSILLLDGPETAEVNRWAKTQQVSVQSALLGALAAVVAEHDGREQVDLVLPVHTRHEARYADAVGWYVGLLPVSIPVHRGVGDGDLVRAAHQAVDEVRHLSSRPFVRIAHLIGLQDAPHFVVSYVDVRHIPGAPEWDGWECRTLRSNVPNADEVYFWIVRSQFGMYLSVRCPAGETASVALEEFAAAYADRLRDMVASGADLGAAGEGVA